MLSTMLVNEWMVRTLSLVCDLLGMVMIAENVHCPTVVGVTKCQLFVDGTRYSIATNYTKENSKNNSCKNICRTAVEKMLFVDVKNAP